MNKCLLVFYSGTNNTTYITNKLKTRLENEGYEVETYRINPIKFEKLDFSQYDLVGIGHPIYGFNLPGIVHKFFKKQTFIKDQRYFIYKNSGETYGANDASSLALRRLIKRRKGNLTNEYHFIMPYNIHFRFDENLVKEMLGIDELLMDILVKEIKDNIPNVKKYKFVNRLINHPMRLTYIGGNINVLFYKVDKKRCINCGLCIQKCQMNNIYRDKRGKIKFHSRCLMCMNCTLNCPKDAIKMGLFNSWRVNKPYNFKEIEKIELKEPIITENTKGFFKCYIKTYEQIKTRHKELFGE
ncbi:MAG: EFR1 family ferrodoxin [Bacilli bacterium]|nr:EFR1 family ferrodoxin [Bacilli bacterium]